MLPSVKAILVNLLHNMALAAETDVKCGIVAANPQSMILIARLKLLSSVKSAATGSVQELMRAAR